MIRAITLCILTLSLAFPVTLAAQVSPEGESSGGIFETQLDLDNTISTDRPDSSIGSGTVSPGKVRIEFGYQYTWDDEGVDSHKRPLAFVRIGIVEDLELRLEWSGYSFGDVEDDDSFSNAGNLGIGFKVKLWDQSGIVPTTGLFGRVRLPTGHESDYINSFIGAVGLSFSHIDRLSSFIEYFGTASDIGGPTHNIDGGFLYLLNSNVQVDINAGFDLK